MESDLDAFFKRTSPKVEERARLIRAAEVYQQYLDGWQEEGRQFPHCDPRVLHSPRSCKYCDQEPLLQKYRTMCGLPFTDDLQANDALLPGETRTRASAEAWGGNRHRKGRDARNRDDG